MPRHTDPETSPTDHAGGLRRLLDDLIAAPERMLGAIDDQRAAVAAADTTSLADATRRQGEIGAEIAAIEQRRRELVVEILRDHPALPRGSAGQPTLSTLCAVLPEPERTRARERAELLRALLERVRRESAGLRAATSSLIAHMDGLMVQLGRRLSHAGTYTRAGAPGAGATVVSGIDLTS